MDGRMNSLHRLESAIKGRPVDQIPVSVWCHFGSEHLPPDAVARLHADFQAAYCWDFMKVMFDYRLDVPDGVDGPAGLDLRLMLDTVDWAAPFQRQIEVLQALRSTLGSSVPMVDTVYSPWMYLVRHLGADLKGAMLEQHDSLTRILALLTEETCKHVGRVRDLGCFGIYFPTLAAERTPWPSLIDLQLPFDKEVLGAASGMVRMLHLHGDKLDVHAVDDYPREVLHWDESERTNPSLSGLRAGNGCLMGGLAPAGLTGMSMSAFRKMATDAIVRTGGLGFVLAPGCTVSPSLSSRKLQALRDASLLRPPS